MDSIKEILKDLDLEKVTGGGRTLDESKIDFKVGTTFKIDNDDNLYCVFTILEVLPNNMFLVRMEVYHNKVQVVSRDEQFTYEKLCAMYNELTN